MTRVVRVGDPHDVRIDRRTPWGNPFPITPQRDRYQAIDEFEEWMRYSDDPKAKWIRANIHTLAGKTLACHCAPEACHGDILAFWADKKAAERLVTQPSVKVRHDARDTSVKAAAAVLPRTGTARARVLLAIADKPSTDEEMQNLLSMKNSTQCPRRIECVEAGWVQDSGNRALTSSGQEAIVWELTPEGHQIVKALRS
jgi:hypothetical protein